MLIEIVPPAVQNNLLAFSAILLFIGIVVLSLIWRLKAPATSFMLSFLDSEVGRKSLSAGVRAFIVTEECKLLIEGIVNGKVRRELKEHDQYPAAHFERLKEYNTVADFTAGMNSLRREFNELQTLIASGRSVISNKIDVLDEKFEDIRRSIETLNTKLDR